MKKTLIIIGIVIVAIIIASITFFIATRNSAENQNVSTGTLPPVASSTPFNPPTGSTLMLGTSQGSVTMNNFYNTAVQISPDHTSVEIVQTDAYNITYYVPDSSFNILITQTPFAASRAAAEAAFLQTLGISQADACKLNVQIGTTYYVDPADSGQYYGLSFCPGTATQ